MLEQAGEELGTDTDAEWEEATGSGSHPWVPSFRENRSQESTTALCYPSESNEY